MSTCGAGWATWGYCFVYKYVKIEREGEPRAYACMSVCVCVCDCQMAAWMQELVSKSWTY